MVPAAAINCIGRDSVDALGVKCCLATRSEQDGTGSNLSAGVCCARNDSVEGCRVEGSATLDDRLRRGPSRVKIPTLAKGARMGHPGEQMEAYCQFTPRSRRVETLFVAQRGDGVDR